MQDRARWLHEAGYGIFCHWTTHSQPKSGEKKAHRDAVRDFDVDTFTKQIIDTGARFLFCAICAANKRIPQNVLIKAKVKQSSHNRKAKDDKDPSELIGAFSSSRKHEKGNNNADCTESVGYYGRKLTCAK